MTDYIVLRRKSVSVTTANAGTATGEVGWGIIGHAESSNPHSARKAVDPGEGEFLVVPRRNATFISGTIITPEPKAVSVEVDADTYLDVQGTLPTEPDHGGPTGDIAPVDPEPVAA